MDMWFCQCRGGILIIGKNDQGQVTGLKGARKLLEDIPNKVRDILGIMVDVNLRRENGREYLEIVVAPYPYPVSYKGEYHYRSGSTKQELKGAALDRFLLRKQGRHWDGVPVPGVDINDLSSTALSEFRHRAGRSQRVSEETLAETDQILMERLHLLDGKFLKRAALREALLNAVSHKDYSSSVPIQISAYPDKLMIWNPGQLPPDWTIRQLLEKHASLPFNPDIANVFFRAGMVESWGRGIERIMQACSEAGIPTPELHYEQTGLWITFTFMPTETTPGKKKSSEKIMAIITEEPHISARNIAEQLGLTSRAVEKQIAQLKAAGRLKRIGPARGGYWEVTR